MTGAAPELPEFANQIPDFWPSMDPIVHPDKWVAVPSEHVDRVLRGMADRGIIEITEDSDGKLMWRLKGMKL